MHVSNIPGGHVVGEKGQKECVATFIAFLQRNVIFACTGTGRGRSIGLERPLESSPY